MKSDVKSKSLSLAQSHEGTEKRFFLGLTKKHDLALDLLCGSVPPCDAGFDLDLLCNLGVLGERTGLTFIRVNLYPAVVKLPLVPLWIFLLPIPSIAHHLV